MKKKIQSAVQSVCSARSSTRFSRRPNETKGCQNRGLKKVMGGQYSDIMSGEDRSVDKWAWKGHGTGLSKLGWV